MAELDMAGDSNTAGYNVTAAQKYATLLGGALGLTVVNRGANNDMAADQGQKAVAVARDASDVATILVGTNDARIYLDNSTKRGYYLNYLRRLCVDAAAPSRNAARGANCTRTGSWANTQVNSIGVNSTAAGSKVTSVVTGSVVYVGYIIQNHPDCAGATLQVKIDGVVKGNISCDGTGGSTTANGQTYGPACARFGGLANGGHTVEVEVISSGKYCYVDYIAANSQNGARVYCGNIFRMTAAGYAAYGGSDAIIAGYNSLIATMTSELESDGLKVKLVDVHTVVLPGSDLQADGVHLNPNGHVKVKDAFLAVINNTPPPPQIVTYPTNWNTTLKITLVSGKVTEYVEV